MTVNAKNPTEYLVCEMEDVCVWVDAANEQEAVEWFLELLPDGPHKVGPRSEGGFWPVYDACYELVNDLWIPETRPYQEEE